MHSQLAIFIIYPAFIFQALLRRVRNQGHNGSLNMNQSHSSHRSALNWTVYNPWKVISATLLFVMFLGYFMQFVAPSISFKDLLGEDWPSLKSYESMQKEYIADDNLLVMIEAKDGDAFTQDILAGTQALTAALWKTPYSIRVESVTNFQHTRANGDDLEVGDLIPLPRSLSYSGLQEAKDIALNDPIALHRVVNPSGNVLAVNVVFHFPMVSGDEKLIAFAAVESLVDQFRQDQPQTNVYIGGLTALDATVMMLSMNETGLFLGLVLLLAVVLLVVLLRSIVPVLVSVIVMLFSVMAALALSGMMGWKMTPFTSIVPMLVLIIAIADCIHFITVFVKRMNLGEDKKLALCNSLKINIKAIVITSVTTAIGFLTFNFSGSDSIAALGNESAFGVMVAGLLSLTFLPAMLSLLPVKVYRPNIVPAGRYQKLAQTVFTYRRGIFISCMVVTVLLGTNIPKNTFDDNIPTYFSETLPWRQANDFGEKQFGSAFNFTYSLSAEAGSSVADPAYLQKVEAFTDYLRELPKAAYVKSLADTFKRLNKSMHGDDPAYYRLPEDRNLAAQYLLMYEMSLPYGLDLSDQINLDKSASKILVAFESMSVVDTLALDKDIKRWLATNMPETEALSSGVQIMFAELISQDTIGLTFGAVLGLLIISMLLIFMLRSVKLGLISVLPNLIPIVMAFGLWGLLVGQVGFGLAMVSGMSIGIIVDDTVHFLTKYLYGRRTLAMNAKDAVAYTYETVGSSLVFTTLVLVSAFLIMMGVSEFRVNTDMGKMTSLILCFALLFDLLALPALLMMFDQKEFEQEASNANNFESNATLSTIEA